MHTRTPAVTVLCCDLAGANLHATDELRDLLPVNIRVQLLLLGEVSTNSSAATIMCLYIQHARVKTNPARTTALANKQANISISMGARGHVCVCVCVCVSVCMRPSVPSASLGHFCINESAQLCFNSFQFSFGCPASFDQPVAYKLNAVPACIFK